MRAAVRCLTALVFLGATARAADDGGKGKLLRQVWNTPGSFIADLTNEDDFPDYPAATETITAFETPVDKADNYGQLVRGYLHPPATGEYTFWIASDDQSQLFLGTNDDPATKRVIASVNEWTGPKEWEKFPTQKSQPVKLEAGKRYYVEAIHKEGIGGDSLSVGWKLPDGTMERPIPSPRLSAFVAPKPGPRGPKPPPTQPGHYKRKIEIQVGSNKMKIPYLLYLPPDYASDPSPKPVLVFLHGVGERGTDLSGVYGWGPDGRILDVKGFKEKYPFIGIAPNCPTSHRWENPEMIQAVVASIEEVLKTYRCDRNRVYLTGLSMGGRGTWEVALAAPQLFTAIAPISSVAVRPEEAAQKLKNVSTFVICGANDGDFTKGSILMHETMKKSTAVEAKFMKHEGWGHDVWREYYPYAGERMYAWFLTKTKGAK